MPRLTMLGPRMRIAQLGRVRVLTTGADQRIRGYELGAIKRKIARRSRGWCECALCRHSEHPLPAQEYDHIVPLWEGGGNEFANWQHLNGDCHKRKTAAEARRRLGIEEANPC
jgi:5-methylcytosine-specific restriction protein A